MQALAARSPTGCLTPSITTPAFVRYTRENVGADIDVGCTVVASIHATDRDAGRDGAREIAGMYLANKLQNIQGSADTLLDLAGIEQDEIRPVAEAMERGGRLAAKAKVTDALLDRCKPIAGTPADCIAAIEEYRDAGLHARDARALGRTTGTSRSGSSPSACCRTSADRRVAIDADRLVELGDRRRSDAELHRRRAGDGRADGRDARRDGPARAVAAGRGGARERARDLGAARAAGRALMFNGHMDTSYSGREPWLAGVPGFQPKAFVKDGRLFGLGISNMKGALACYVEAVRALQDAGVRLRGDVLIAAVCGEIEKAQWGDAQGAEFRGYAAGSRYLVSHGGVADMCILGEPTEGKVVLGHFGSLWLRISTRGNFIHTAFSEGKRDAELDPAHARGARGGARVDPGLGGRPGERLPRRAGDRERRRDPGRLRLARLADAASHRPLPRRSRAADEADGERAARGARHGARARGALPRLRDRGRGVRHRSRAPRSRRATR